MKIIAIGDGLIIKSIKDFDPVHTFECGQCFRWNREGEGYVGIVGNKVIKVVAEDEDILLYNATMEDYNILWKKYFDLDRDYGDIKGVLSNDPILAKAITYGWGIRILNQDPWETLISFIISANNGISRIKGIIENICKLYGDRIEWKGRTYYTFPKPDTLANAKIEDLRGCSCGYRAEYIKATSQMVADGTIDLHGISNMPYERAHKELLRCMGVGPKVADCILLFSMEKGEAFPVDVWVRRVMEYFYLKDGATPKKIKAFSAEKFGELAGYAQQYLFYYAREKKIGV